MPFVILPVQKTSKILKEELIKKAPAVAGAGSDSLNIGLAYLKAKMDYEEMQLK